MNFHKFQSLKFKKLYQREENFSCVFNMKSSINFCSIFFLINNGFSKEEDGVGGGHVLIEFKGGRPSFSLF